MTIHHSGGELPPDIRALIEAGRDGPTATPEQRRRIDRALYRRLTLGAFVTLLMSSWTTWTRAGWVKPSGLIALSAVGGILVHQQLQVPADQGQTSVQFVAVPAEGPTAERTSALPDASSDDGGQVSSPAEAFRKRYAAADADPITEAPAAETAFRKNAASGRAAPPRAVTASPSSTERAPKSGTVTSERATVPVSDPLAREVELLAAARRALGQGSATQAQSFLRQYDRDVRSHVLAQERVATGVLVSCALGQISRAKRVAADFRKRHPRSPLNARLNQSCAAHDE